MSRRRALPLAAAIFVVALGCGHKPPYEGRSVAELRRMLSDSNPSTRIQGAYGLSLQGDKAREAVPDLVRSLQSSDVLLRAQAALALGAIGPGARDAVPALAAALDDAEWSVRRQAAVALGQIGPDARQAVPALRRLQSNDPNGLVRKAVEQALPRIEG